ncbi:MAG: response regulator [Thermodesulfovibrionales bacterium]
MSKTILIVDDSIVVRQLVTITLKKEGYTVIEAVNGKDGLAKASKSPIDMVISDLNMPEMNGIEFIRELRSLDAFRLTPIIMLTTVSEEGKKQEGAEAGVNGWLFKPFNATQLLTTIRKFI